MRDPEEIPNEGHMDTSKEHFHDKNPSKNDERMVTPTTWVAQLLQLGVRIHTRDPVRDPMRDPVTLSCSLPSTLIALKKPFQSSF